MIQNKKMTSRATFALAGALLLSSVAAQADTYTYHYAGPTFLGGSDHVEITFTTSAPLPTAKSLLNTTAAGVLTGSVTVAGPSGSVYSLPISTFQLHTNSAASSGVPGIDAWFVIGDISQLTGLAPTMTGVHTQAYTMNTMTFIPGSDIAGATGLVTGHYAYDQATQTTFYSSCSGITGCQLAGNGQPYVGNYSGIINPSYTSASNWTLTQNVTNPPVPPPPPVVSGTLPDGTVGVAYSSNGLTVSGGEAPYAWTASGLPAGLTIDPTSGAIAGTPTAAGTYSALTISVTDNLGVTASTSVSLVIQAAPVSCADSNAPVTGVNKFWLDLNGGLKNGGQSVVYTATAAGTIFTGGTTGFAVGELVDYVGTLDDIGMCHATSMTVKPKPVEYSCTKPASAKTLQAKGKITAVGNGYIVVGTTVLQTPSCTKVSWNGATGFAVGQRAEYKAYQSGSAWVATSITIN